MARAIVTGATGITGTAIVNRLVKDESYSKIYTLSRISKGQDHPKVQHVNLDLQADLEHMTQQLSGVAAEFVFFCAYLARDDPYESNRVNGLMLSNFLVALEKTGGTKPLRRFILTCGFKHYGVHLGRVKQPSVEDDPLLSNEVDGVDWPPIFYYQQEETLAAAAARSHWEWICTLPEDVLGFAEGNFMNEATALGLYCAVSKALPGSELPFPGNRTNYLAFNTWTSSDLHAQFCLWAAKAPGAGNQIFNVTNGDSESFQNLWPKLAQRFGCKLPNPMFASDAQAMPAGFKDYQSATIRMKNRHPLFAHAEALGLLGDPYVEDSPKLQLQIDPEKWAKRSDVNKAWEKLRDKYYLDQSAWEKATWNFLTFVLGRDWHCIGSMSKARKLGWVGYADTWDELEKTFELLEKAKILPPVEKLKEEF